MPRPVRIDIEGHWYHVIARGQRKDKLFLDPRDYEQYLKDLGIALDRRRGVLGAYCLMPNHVHLLIYRGANSLASAMQIAHSRFGRYFNCRYKKSGYVFQGRYKAFLVLDDVYLDVLIRYIHRNPVVAGLVENPQRYRWSSDRFYRGESRRCFVDLVRVPGFEGEGGEGRYKESMRELDGDEPLPVYKSYIGKRGSESGLEKRKSGREASKWRERRGFLEIERRADELAMRAGIKLRNLKMRSRKRVWSRCRRGIMNKLYAEGYTVTEIARTFQRTPSSVFYAASLETDKTVIF